MAASRTDASLLQSTVVVETLQGRSPITSPLIRLDRHGAEFRSRTPFELWTEMTVTLDRPSGGSRQEGTGVVVSCEGNRHWGYTVSVLFLEGMSDTKRAPSLSNRVRLG